MGPETENLLSQPLPPTAQLRVDVGIDGGELGGDVAPETLTLGMHDTPHPEEHPEEQAEEDAESRDYRCDGVWSHVHILARRRDR